MVAMECHDSHFLSRVREIRGTDEAEVERNTAISPFKWNNYERGTKE